MGLLILFFARMVIRWEGWFEVVYGNVEKFVIEMGEGVESSYCLWGVDWQDGGEKYVKKVATGDKFEACMSGVLEYCGARVRREALSAYGIQVVAIKDKD